MSLRCLSQFLLALGFVLLFSPPLAAHKIKVFATVEGGTITGSGYYPGGGTYKNSPVMVYDSAGQLVGKVVTDHNGHFAYSPKARHDHIFVITTADGHGARYTVAAAELPADVPLPRGNGQKPSAAAGGATMPTPETGNRSSAELQRLVDRAVARHITPLRRQLEEYEQQVRLHDILGGIGYLLGITGIFCYFLAWKKQKR